MVIHESKMVPSGFAGITIWPFIFLANKKEFYTLKLNGRQKYNNLIRHERIHLRQQLGLLVLPFFVIYALNYLINLIRYGNTDLAYRNIVFEREAYANEKDMDYLNMPRFYSWLKYL